MASTLWILKLTIWSPITLTSSKRRGTNLRIRHQKNKSENQCLDFRALKRKYNCDLEWWWTYPRLWKISFCRCTLRERSSSSLPTVPENGRLNMLKSSDHWEFSYYKFTLCSLNYSSVWTKTSLPFLFVVGEWISCYLRCLCKHRSRNHLRQW